MHDNTSESIFLRCEYERTNWTTERANACITCIPSSIRKYDNNKYFFLRAFSIFGILKSFRSFHLCVCVCGRLVTEAADDGTLPSNERPDILNICDQRTLCTKLIKFNLIFSIMENFRFGHRCNNGYPYFDVVDRKWEKEHKWQRVFRRDTKSLNMNFVEIVFSFLRVSVCVSEWCRTNESGQFPSYYVLSDLSET